MITLTHNHRIITHHTVPLNGQIRLVPVAHGLNAPFLVADPLSPNNSVSIAEKPTHSVPNLWHPVGRTVQLSDLHFFENTDPAYYEAVLNEVHQLQPDLIAITGDVIHHGSAYIGKMAAFVAALPEKATKFAVLGNHDYDDDANGNKVKQALQQANVAVLVNQSSQITIGSQTLNIVGLDDLYCGKPNIEKAFSDINPSLPTLALFHNPLLADNVAKHAPIKPFLALSGHTHAGHVYIPALKPIYRHVLGHKYRYGFYGVPTSKSETMPLYVTSGLGGAAYYVKIGKVRRALPRFRWNTHPEIAVFDLVIPV